MDIKEAFPSHPLVKVEYLSSHDPNYKYHVGSKCTSLDYSTLDKEEMSRLDKGMSIAFEQAYLALESREVPIGCVVMNRNDGTVLAKGRNKTNENHDGISHAEMEALEILYSLDQSKTDPLFYQNLEFYVTVEPCIMCAAALRLAGISRVTFGCWNERFGGCGSTLDAHLYYVGSHHHHHHHHDDNNDDNNEKEGTANTPAIQPLQTRQTDKYKAEAINLLRKFYLLQNEKAPKPNLKSNRVYKPYTIDNDDDDSELKKEKDKSKINSPPFKSPINDNGYKNDNDDNNDNGNLIAKEIETGEIIPPFDPKINYAITDKRNNKNNRKDKRQSF